MVELLLTRLSQFALFRRFGTTLLVSMEKPGAARGQGVPEVSRTRDRDVARESAA
jgi:hypothetical protein